MNESNPRKFKFRSALVETAPGKPEWRNNVVVTIHAGQIINVQPDVVDAVGTLVEGAAIPAMVNVHSHAFQRGFAGLSEFRTASNDSFWTWRNLMYEFVRELSPEDVFVIARQVYLEMVIAGYSWVGEFHYLHNDPAGKPYANRGEMAGAILRAADETKIGICLLPVLYQRSGFATEHVEEGQLRFALANDDYFGLLEICQKKTRNTPDALLGMAIHSLRAVGRNSIAAALEYRDAALPDCPIHIHAAEQTQELEDCLAATGKRSIEYLLSTFAVDPRWCLIHATHMNQSETENLAASGATVGLCPTTEANLGDGFFPAQEFLSHNGSISIGSDSHCSVDVRDEIRTLEYGQRLKTRNRSVLGTATESVGRRLYLACSTGGGKAIGVATGSIAIGFRADMIVINDQHPTIAGAAQDRLLDRLIFSNSGNPISKRMIGGQWIGDSELQSAWQKSSDEFFNLNRRFLGSR